jgi:hypothetical protein
MYAKNHHLCSTGGGGGVVWVFAHSINPWARISRGVNKIITQHRNVESLVRKAVRTKLEQEGERLGKEWTSREYSV